MTYNMLYISECYLTILLMCVEMCRGAPHTVVTAGWGFPYSWTAKCEFDVPAGVTSWTINITFDKDVTTFNAYEAIILTSEGQWKCVKNQYGFSVPYSALVQFQGVYTVAPEPVGECHVLLDGTNSCLDGSENQGVTSTTTHAPTTTTTTTSATTTTTLVATTPSPTPSPTSTTTATPSIQSTAVSTSTTASTSTSCVTTVSLTPTSLCLCNSTISTISEEEFAEIIASLTIDKSTVSATVRKKTSAEDDRPSSKGMGCIGVIVIVCVLALIVAPDVVNLFNEPSAKVPRKPCKSKVEDLNNDVPNSNNGTTELNENVPDSASELTGDIPGLTDNAPELTDSIPEMTEGVPELTNDIPEILSVAPELPNSVPGVCHTAPELSDDF